MAMEWFQSLDWVERLSDPIVDASRFSLVVFQSLDWVERLSDPYSRHTRAGATKFQSLDWVERLSDRRIVAVFGPSKPVSIPRLG